MAEEMSLLALLEEDSPDDEQPLPSQPGTEIDNEGDDDGDGDADGDGQEDDEEDDDEEDMMEELEAELDKEDAEDDDGEDDEDEGDGSDTEPPTTAPAPTPGPTSGAPTPAPSSPPDAETESDDNKIGEDDIGEIEEEDMATPAVTLGTPGPSTLPTSSPGPANFTSVVNVDGGMDEGMGDEAEDDEQEAGASNALRTEKDKKKQMQQEGGCQLTTKEIEMIFDTRQKAESSPPQQRLKEVLTMKMVYVMVLYAGSAWSSFVKVAAGFDNIQMERYERFKRSRIRNPSMKKLVDALAGRAVNPNVVMVLCGVTKMFVGELTEHARKIAARGGHHGPLLPVHVYEAHQAMQASGEALPQPKRARLFR